MDPSDILKYDIDLENYMKMINSLEKKKNYFNILYEPFQKDVEIVIDDEDEFDSSRVKNVDECENK